MHRETEIVSGRTILITGASSGIGEALALEFARRGYSLALAARRVDRLQELQRRCRAAGGHHVAVYGLDVSDGAAVMDVVSAAATELGRLDVVVANAGIAELTPAGRGRFAEIRQTILVNVVGAMATIEAALPILRAQGGGQIVGITSMAGWRGLPGFGAYSASKAALHRYLQALRCEVRGEGIVVTELAPGYIDTDINRGRGPRPFVIPVERGGAIMARMIESHVGYRTVPVWPWTLIGPLLKVVPDMVLDLQRRDRGGRTKGRGH